MDYQFKRDILGLPIAKFSMGHEAVGRWLTDELAGNKVRILSLIDIIEKIEQSKIGFRELTGSEFQISLSLSGVEINAITTDFDLGDFMLEKTHLYQEESFSECGLQDFKQAVLSWLDYVG